MSSDTRYEIVHLSQADLDLHTQGPFAKVAKGVAALREQNIPIHYILGSDVIADIPSELPPETPIVIGGSLLGGLLGMKGLDCVGDRYRALQNAGFTNVAIDPALTVSYMEPMAYLWSPRLW